MYDQFFLLLINLRSLPMQLPKMIIEKVLINQFISYGSKNCHYCLPPFKNLFCTDFLLKSGKASFFYDYNI